MKNFLPLLCLLMLGSCHSGAGKASYQGLQLGMTRAEAENKRKVTKCDTGQVANVATCFYKIEGKERRLLGTFHNDRLAGILVILDVKGTKHADLIDTLISKYGSVTAREEKIDENTGVRTVKTRFANTSAYEIFFAAAIEKNGDEQPVALLSISDEKELSALRADEADVTKVYKF